MLTDSKPKSLQRLRREAQVLKGSIVLTPVDNFPNLKRFGDLTSEFHGLYASDKQRSEAEQKSAKIQFSGRSRLTREISSIHRRLARAFDCSHASLRLLSGLHAHIVLFMALSPIGAKVALLPETAGGHFATPAILKRLGLSVIPLPVNTEGKCVNSAEALTVIERENPDILFVDRSEGLRYEDFSELGRCKVPIRIFDSSQYAAQIIAGLYENPFSWGFNLQILTLHKSFPGPQKAAVLCNNDLIWGDVLSGLSAFVSSSHIENSYLVGLILDEKRQLDQYAHRLISVKENLEAELLERAVPVVPTHSCGKASWPATQHIWISLRDQDHAFEAWKGLERNRIQTNYRKLPYDLGWGLRLGVTAAVSRGLTVDHTAELASLISNILLDTRSNRFRRAVSRLASEMRPNAPFGESYD
jgi:glycine hydroxymethyltransferase